MDRRQVLLAALILGATSCSVSPTDPTRPSTTLRVTSIAPVQGSTTGTTNITINGANFASDATVTVGGVAATQILREDSTVLRAVVGAASAAGTADVIVTSNGQSATLAKAFTFVAPSGTNQPPVITSIRSIGSHPNQPSGFGDQDETVTLIATVTDAETPLNSLSYTWSGPGTFSSSEAITIWRLPLTVPTIPSPVTATLTVTENFVEGSITHRNVRTAPFVMQVHDSQQEILDMGEDFLRLFSQSNVSTNQVLHNFSTICGGRDAEASDTDRARSSYVQDYPRFRISRIVPIILNFAGRCPVTNNRADACSAFNVHWEITYIKADSSGHYVGQHETTDGVDYVTAVLENNQWRLCASDFRGVSTNPLTGEKRLVAW